MMRLTDARRAFLTEYWRSLWDRHQTAAAMAQEAGVSLSYVYQALAQHGLPAPQRR